MKNLFKLFIISILSFSFTCSKTEEIEPSNQPNENAKITSVILKVSKTSGTFWANESEDLVLSVDVKDESGKTYQNYAGKVSYFVNEVELSSNQFNC